MLISNVSKAHRRAAAEAVQAGPLPVPGFYGLVSRRETRRRGESPSLRASAFLRGVPVCGTWDGRSAGAAGLERVGAAGGAQARLAGRGLGCVHGPRAGRLARGERL